MWWNRKKKHDSRRVQIKHIPLPILIRQAIYDSMLEPAEDIAEVLGLPPISDEVAEMEENASQERLEKFSSLIPFIDAHSDIASRIATASYVLSDDGTKEDVPDQELGRLSSMFKLVALSASLSCISSLISLELIESRTGDEHGE
jgi:hypothetical protein